MANNDEVKKTIGTPSISGPSQPSKAAPSVEYSKNDLGEKVETVTDGHTSTQYSAEHDPVLKALHDKVPGLGKMDFPEKQHYPPCINPSCKSFGKSHPNCKCYAGPGGSSLEGMFAHGGTVCSGAHHESCEHYADGGMIAENEKILNNPHDTLDHIGVHKGLLHLLTKTGHSKSEDPNKPIEEYIDHSRKGRKLLHNHIEHMFTTDNMMPDKNAREALKSHLQDLREHPEKMLEVGGNLASVLPNHAIQLAAKLGHVTDHFNAIRPIQSKANPLDELTPADKVDEEKYDRHLDIAQNPAMVIKHAKEGNLLPSDMQALSIMYPTLHNVIKEKGMEALIDAKSKNMEIPYRHKLGLSTLLGQPMDSTMTPQSMQAIIKSAGPQQVQQKTKTPKKASGVELKQINKVNDLYATADQNREISKRE